MNMTAKTYVIGSIVIAMIVVGTTPMVDAQGPIRDRLRQRIQQRLSSQPVTPYYERDRWVDVTEWFDGNNYNPTNEIVDRLTDRQERRVGLAPYSGYKRSDNWYGYDPNSENNWFFDFYDHGYYYHTAPASSDTYYSYRYYDMDNDGWYDAFTSYYDNDRDGKFDNHRWYTFNYEPASTRSDVVERQPSVDDEDDLMVSRLSVSGTVARTKQSRTPTAVHTIVGLKTDGAAQDEVYVDIGPATDSDAWSIKQGDKMTANGSVIQMDDKRLMLADEIQINEQTHQVVRRYQSWEGVLVDTQQMEFRGQNHVVAIIYTPDKEKVLVDLGMAADKRFDLQNDSEIVVYGVPTEIGDRHIVMAYEIESGDKKIVVDRSELELQVK
jgi:hypothetical protein